MLKGFVLPQEEHASAEITIQHLDALYVVCMQLEVGLVAAVHGPHQRVGELRVAQAQNVADLVGRYDPQVGAIALPLGPKLIPIKVHDA